MCAYLRACVYICVRVACVLPGADERIRSCRCHVLAFPLEWRYATPLSYTPRLRSLSTLAAGIRTYVRMYVRSAGTGFDAFQRTRLLFRLHSARTEREPDAIAGAMHLSIVRTGRKFFLFSRRSAHFITYTDIPEGDGKWERCLCYVSRNSQPISICGDDKALIAKR